MMEDGSGLAAVPRLEPGLNCKGNCRRFWPASAGAAVDFVVEFGEDDSAGGARGERSALLPRAGRGVEGPGDPRPVLLSGGAPAECCCFWSCCCRLPIWPSSSRILA